MEEIDEDDESEDYTSSEDEEPILIPHGRQIPSTSASRTSAASVPVVRNSVEDRVKAQDWLRFQKSRVSYTFSSVIIVGRVDLDYRNPPKAQKIDPSNFLLHPSPLKVLQSSNKPKLFL
jgi:hypothetical protein